MSKKWFGGAVLVAFSAGMMMGCGDDFDGPNSGTWFYAEVSPVENDCNLPEDQFAAGEFSIENNDDGTFTVDPEDGNPAFECTLSGSDFDCPERIAGSYSTQGSTATWRADAEGSFSDASRMTGTQSGQVTCEGSGCALAEAALGASFPCQLEVDFVASFRE